MLIYFTAYLLAGIVIGFISGLFGIGGGIIGIPFLLLLFILQGIPEHISMHMAVGTFFAIVMITSVVTTYTHHRKKMILFPIFKKIIFGMVLGSVVGVIIGNNLNSIHLQHVFGLFLVIIALPMLIEWRAKEVRSLPNKTILFLITSFFGTLSGMMGLGGGLFIVPYLNRYGIPIKNAIATSAACIFPVAIVGVWGALSSHLSLNTIPFSSGFIYWPAFFGISITSMLFAPLGVKTAHALSTSLLKKIFSLLLIVIGMRML